MVLLKNKADLLPFDESKVKSVAVIGQSVDDTNALTGNYDGPLCAKGGADCFPSICKAVEALGVTAQCITDIKSPDIETVASRADGVILVVDNAKDGGGEGHDRYTISLSQDQIQLSQTVLKAAREKTAMVMVNGGVISIDGLKEEANAILEAFMPGVHGGTAIADTIFGRNNPGGKMPVTMYPSNYINAVDFLSMDMTNRSYRYYTGQPLFSFGYGLSYTSFAMKWNNESTSHQV